jgi:hypothetical protein
MFCAALLADRVWDWLGHRGDVACLKEKCDSSTETARVPRVVADPQMINAAAA